MAELLFVSEHAGFFGGVERYMAHAAELLRSGGMRVDGLFFRETHDAALFRSAFDTVWKPEEPGWEAHPYDLVVVHKLRSAEFLRRLKSRFRTAVFVHDHEYYCPRFARYFPFCRKNCHRAYSPSVCGICGSLKRPQEGFLREFRRNFMEFPKLWDEVKSADSLIVLSAFMRENLRLNGVPAERIRVIPPSVKPVDGPRRKTEVPHLLLPGQLIRGKGADQLLAALPMVHHDFVLDILGAGNDEPMLRRMAEPFGDRVVFHGWSTEPERFFESAYAVVLPWRWQEPFGLVGIEALAHGVPLIAFDVGGVREYLEPDRTGLLVKEGDLASLALAVDALLDDPPLAEKLGKNGYELVRGKFTGQAESVGWNSLLENLL